VAATIYAGAGLPVGECVRIAEQLYGHVEAKMKAERAAEEKRIAELEAKFIEMAPPG